MDQFDALRHFVGLEPHQFEQAHLGNGVTVAAAGHNQRRNDRQGQRNLYPNRRAPAESGLKVHRAADFFDVRLHHVHAHATARHIGHLFGGGESRKENQVENLPLRHARSLIGGDHSAFQRLLADALHIQARAIVADFDIDLPAFMKGAQNQPSTSILARLHAVRPEVRFHGPRNYAPDA